MTVTLNISRDRVIEKIKKTMVQLKLIPYHKMKGNIMSLLEVIVLLSKKLNQPFFHLALTSYQANLK